MEWLLFAFLLALIALPFGMERMRSPMSPDTRQDAPGQFAALTDGQTHYEWHGPENGPVAVFVHGLSTPSWVFTGLIRGVNMMGYRVLTYDLFGRGYSDRPRHAQDHDFFDRQLRELLGDQNISGKIVLLGYSMGGAIATVFAAKTPERVERLILLAPAGLDYTPAPLLLRARNWGPVGNWIWGLLGARHLRNGAKSDAGSPTVIPDLPARMSRETNMRGYLRSVLSAERNTLTKSLESEHRALAKSTVSVVSIWGEKDDVIPVSSVGKLTQWNRGAHKVVIPGATHALGYVNPREVLTAIQENLREV